MCKRSSDRRDRPSWLQRGRDPKTAECPPCAGADATTTSFNGAAILRPQNAPANLYEAAWTRMLQRGRDPKTAECGMAGEGLRDLGIGFNGAAILRPQNVGDAD